LGPRWAQLFGRQWLRTIDPAKKPVKQQAGRKKFFDERDLLVLKRIMSSLKNEGLRITRQKIIEVFVAKTGFMGKIYPQRISVIRGELGIKWFRGTKQRRCGQGSARNLLAMSTFVKKERRKKRSRQWFVDQINLKDEEAPVGGYGFYGEDAAYVNKD